jgi:Zn-dependent peptidase ImmA (M78 family)
LWRFVRNAGVDLALHDFGRDGGDGLYYWDGEAGLVVINTGTPWRLRQRFTGAHELGHHVMHRPDSAPFVHADRDIFEGTDEFEEEANAFASHLLAPAPGLERVLREWDVDEVTPNVVALLMQEFGVSYDTTVYRLHNSQLINAATRDRLKREGLNNVRRLTREIGFVENVAYPLPQSPLPDWFEAETMQVFADGGLTEARLAELLRLSVDEAVRRVDESNVESSRGEELSAEELEELLRE